MRRLPSNLARTVALVAAFCALGVGGGCGRQTFNLLPDELQAAAGNTAFGGTDAGRAGSGGTGGTSAGGAGRGGAGGFGGRFGPPPGGGAGNFPCLGEGGCPDEQPFCPPYSPSPFCISCFSDHDCDGEANVCDQDLKRCVQCRRDNDCGIGQACNPLTQRCAKSCNDKDDCAVDSQHLLCSPDLHVCVSCNRNQDCDSYGPLRPYCFVYACVQCFEDRHCGVVGQACVAGRCMKR